jgi:nitroreductase
MDADFNYLAGESSGADDSFQRLLTERYSCRQFLPDPVPRSIVTAFTELAQRTPSWCNTQPWQVTITSGPATERLRTVYLQAASTEGSQPDFDFPQEYAGIYRARRRECGLQLYESVGIASGDRSASRRQALDNYRFFGAPHVATITSARAPGTYGAIDCGGYVNNFMLAARRFGIATIAQAALAQYPHVVRSALSIGEDRAVICGVSFGYTDLSHPVNRFRTSRARQADVVNIVEE